MHDLGYFKMLDNGKRTKDYGRMTDNGGLWDSIIEWYI